ncbi:TonB-dependent receptor [Pontibacter qinzhouensis]|uniref:TonB-dependent receptor n=1 Tax=Pontibacter qinzhouensis TaxID=2603253 RepID=A0A5C8KAZ5_9BACT|nr:TonB-dependent receptor [Pontibacter qinzhouensis]TXK49228.1 TonB-dependent receptor [Pontibacter qinzhouensis]
MKNLLLQSSKVLLLLAAANVAGPAAANATLHTPTSLSATIHLQAKLQPLQNPITGKVTSAKGEPLPGVTVVLKGSSTGTITDLDGNFSLPLNQNNGTLVFSYVGYQTKELAYTGQQRLRVSLSEDARALSEVVVVGYGMQERKNLIGSIAKVDPSETKGIAVGSLDAQLQGKVAGVQISSPTGVPGEASNIRVRGATSINASNDPLYVIDGVFINGNSLQTLNTGGKATSPIADINPSDIESIEVLKDATATALYGARGANGVVIVTTRRGNYNQKPKISFNTSHGWAKAVKLWDLTTGPEHAELVNEHWVNTGLDNPALNRTEANRPYRPVAEGGRGLPEEQQTYDRLSEVFRTAAIQNYDLSLSGGTSTTKYYISGGYTNQESILKPIGFERASFKVNLDQNVSDKVKVGTSNSFSRTVRNQGRAGDGPRGGLLQAALHSPTVLSPYNASGELVGRAGFDNVTLLLENYDVNTTSLRYIGNLYAEAELLPNLKFKTSFGVDYNNYDESEYWNTFLIEGSQGGLATSSLTQYSSLLNEQTLFYKKTLSEKHTLGVLVGNTLQKDVLSRTYAEGRGFANNEFKIISSAATTLGSQSWSANTLASFFSRIDYNYGGKYLLDISFRADGSSRFGANNKWGYFPAVGAAWRVKEENFLRDVEALSDLKLKTSYGITGNQGGISNFAAQGLWTGGTPYQDNPGTAPQQLGNPDLKWEETRQFNLGLEAGFINNRLALEANVYHKYTTNGLLQIPLPATTGFSSYWSNAAEISNKGFELGINSVNVNTNDFTWSTSFNIARNINKIEKLENPLRYGSRDLILQQEGHPLYSFWVYNQLYVDPQTGDAVYEDVNQDGRITTEDRLIVGDIWPKYFGGLTNNFTYKGFDLSAFLAFQFGNKVYNHNAFFGEAGGARDEARVIFANNLNRWQQPGDITDVPRIDGININNYRDGGSRWLEDGSFVRLRSLNLGYTLPKNLTEKLHLETLRLYFSGTNLFLLTQYTGADPESSASSSPNAQGIDLGTPPQPRTLQFGLNLTL